MVDTHCLESIDRAGEMIAGSSPIIQMHFRVTQASGDSAIKMGRGRIARLPGWPRGKFPELS